MKSLKLKVMAIVAATAVVMSMNGHTQVYASESTSYTEVVDGKTIECSLSADRNYATAITTYTKGSGVICTNIRGYAYYKSMPIDSRDKTYSYSTGNVNTPNSASASISIQSDYALEDVFSDHIYSIVLTPNTNGVGEINLDIIF